MAMTFKQAAFLVASNEIVKAIDWEWAVYCNPKLPRKALKKARLEVTAAEMRARRILAATGPRQLPAPIRIEIQRRMEA